MNFSSNFLCLSIDITEKVQERMRAAEGGEKKIPSLEDTLARLEKLEKGKEDLQQEDADGEDAEGAAAVGDENLLGDLVEIDDIDEYEDPGTILTFHCLFFRLFFSSFHHCYFSYVFSLSLFHEFLQKCMYILVSVCVCGCVCRVWRG